MRTGQLCDSEYCILSQHILQESRIYVKPVPVPVAVESKKSAAINKMENVTEKNTHTTGPFAYILFQVWNYQEILSATCQLSESALTIPAFSLSLFTPTHMSADVFLCRPTYVGRQIGQCEQCFNRTQKNKDIVKALVTNYDSTSTRPPFDCNLPRYDHSTTYVMMIGLPVCGLLQ